MDTLRRTVLCLLFAGKVSWAMPPTTSCLIPFAAISEADLNETLVHGTYRSLLDAYSSKLGLAELVEMEKRGDPFVLDEKDGHDRIVARRQFETFRNLLAKKGWDTPSVRAQLIAEVRARITNLEKSETRRRRQKWDDYSLMLPNPKRDGTYVHLQFISPEEGKLLAWRWAVPVDKEDKEAELRVFTIAADGKTARFQADTDPLALGSATPVISPDGSALLIAAKDGWYHKVPWKEGDPDWSHAVSVHPKSWMERLVKSPPKSSPPVQSVVVGTGEGRLVSLFEDMNRKHIDVPKSNALNQPHLFHDYYLEVFDPTTKSITKRRIPFSTFEWATNLYSIPEKNQILVASLRKSPIQELEVVLSRFTIGHKGELTDPMEIKAWAAGREVNPSWNRLVPGGKYFLTVTGDPSSRRLVSYSLENGKETPLLTSNIDQHTVAVSRDGQILAARKIMNGKSELSLIEIESGKSLLVTTVPSTIEGMFFSSDGDSLYLSEGSEVHVVNLARRLQQ